MNFYHPPPSPKGLSEVLFSIYIDHSVISVLAVSSFNFFLLPLLLLFFLSLLFLVLTGSPSRRGDVAVYVYEINQPSLPSPFYSVLVSVSVFMAISTVFQSVNSPDNSPPSHSVLLVLLLPIGPFNYISLYESLPQP